MFFSAFFGASWSPLPDAPPRGNPPLKRPPSSHLRSLLPPSTKPPLPPLPSKPPSPPFEPPFPPFETSPSKPPPPPSPPSKPPPFPFRTPTSLPFENLPTFRRTPLPWTPPCPGPPATDPLPRTCQNIAVFFHSRPFFQTFFNCSNYFVDLFWWFGRFQHQNLHKHTKFEDRRGFTRCPESPKALNQEHSAESRVKHLMKSSALKKEYSAESRVQR